MQQKIKKIIASIIFLLIVSLFYIFYQGLNSTDTSLKSALIDKKAPQFSSVDFFSNKKINSDSLFINQYTLLNVFASWCISCKDEHKVLMKIKREGQLKIVGINYKDKRDDAIDFLNQLGNPYHTIVADNGTIGFDYGVYAVPETFLIDKQGIIRYKLVGVLSDEIYENQIKNLIKESNEKN